MNFAKVCERSGLDQEAVKFYVSEKLITPLFPEKQSAEAAEYAEDDLLRLAAIANLRKLRFSTDDVRKILYNPAKAAGLTLSQFSRLEKKSLELSTCIKQLEEMDLAIFNNPDEVIALLAGLDIDVSLPRRDLNRDDEARMRAAMDEKSLQNEAMHEQLLQLEKNNKKHLLFSLICLFLFILCLGFILGPYIFW